LGANCHTAADTRGSDVGKEQTAESASPNTIDPDLSLNGAFAILSPRLAFLSTKRIGRPRLLFFI